MIQEHHARRLHYDFRLEHQDVLLSWAVPKGPSTDPSVKRLAVHVEDHPVDYASFEGVIPAGNYGAGEVRIWDRGTWTPRGDVDEGLRQGKLEFSLSGSRLRGNWVLVKIHGKDDEDPWLLIKESDELSVTELPIPSFQLCTLRSHAPEGAGWAREVKWDGYRAMAISTSDGCEFRTRGGLELNLPHLSSAIRKLTPDDLILDGEVVALDAEGKSDFGSLQRALKGNSSAVSYVAFDLLRLGDESLLTYPFSERRARLEALLASASLPLLLSPLLPGNVDGLLHSACEIGLEGIVSKKLDSPYSGGRSTDWIKVKCSRTGEAVVGGYTFMKGTDDRIGALLLGHRVDGHLRYVGQVGTGFDEAERRRLFELLRASAVRECPFTGIRPFEAKGAHWVRPELVVRYRYVELSNDHRLRQASYRGIRS